jgi:hypothetical protein
VARDNLGDDGDVFIQIKYIPEAAARQLGCSMQPPTATARGWRSWSTTTFGLHLHGRGPTASGPMERN